MIFFRKITKWALTVMTAVLLFTIFQVLVFRWIPVLRTPLMVQRSRENRSDKKYHTHYKWVPLSDISSAMVMAVIASEDNRFMEHSGFDWIEIEKALNKENRARVRGASTISQQTAKNVFLLPARSWIRKGMEAYYTILIEILWGKQRIMEVYLNVAEMGKGIYGAEAAAQYYYKKPAAKLTSLEAAMVAACLPNPLKRNPVKPTTYLLARQAQIQNLMGKVATPDFLNREKKT